MCMFNKLTVIELASVLAGPSVGTFFAELGARVIKVENATTGGDMTRHWFSRSEPNSGTSAYFSSVNYKKEYLQRNLNQEEHQDEIHKLIKDADIVLSNFKESTAKKFRVDFESLKKVNPNVILGVITGFPHTSRPAFDVVLQAETGFLSMTGSDHEHLAKMPVAMVDVLAAHQLKEGLLIALLKRQSDPKAYRVNVTLYEAALASLINQGSNYLMTGVSPEPIGTKHPNIAPYGDIFTTSDNRKVVLAVGTQNQFAQLCEYLDLTELITDSRFSDNASRVKNRKALIDILTKTINQFDRKTLMKNLLDHGIPAGAVKTLEEVFDDEQAQKLVLTETIDGTETKRVKGNIFSVSS